MSKDTTVKVTRVLQDAIQDDPMAAGIKLGVNGFYHEVWDGDKLYCFSSPVDFTSELLDTIDMYVQEEEYEDDYPGIIEADMERGILTQRVSGSTTILQVVNYDELKLPQ